MRNTEQTIRDGQKLAELNRHRPQIDDLKSEGVISGPPTENADGSVTYKIRHDHEAVKRALEMDAEYKSYHAEYHEELASRPEARARDEFHAEQRARRSGARVSITVPELPWKRER